MKRQELVQLYENAAATERSCGHFDTANLYAEIAHAAEQGLLLAGNDARFRGLSGEFSVMLKGEAYQRAYRAFAYGYEEPEGRHYRVCFRRVSGADVAALFKLEADPQSLFLVQLACLLHDTAAALFDLRTGAYVGDVGDDSKFYPPGFGKIA